MKLTNVRYATVEEQSKLLTELKIKIGIVQKCSCLVIRKDDTDIIFKDRWRDPFISNEENINVICKRNFLVVSRQLLARMQLTKADEQLIQVGDSLLILF